MYIDMHTHVYIYTYIYMVVTQNQNNLPSVLTVFAAIQSSSDGGVPGAWRSAVKLC